MGQKLSSKLSFIYSPNKDGFYIFHISQGSVATQLRCCGAFSNHFIINFPQNASVKKFENRSIFDKYMDKTLWLTFLSHPVVIGLQICQKLSEYFITARCTLVQSAVLRSHVVCLSVCLSVTLVDCDHIGGILRK